MNIENHRGIGRERNGKREKERERQNIIADKNKEKNH